MENLGYLRGGTADYIEELLERYKADPTSIDESWRYFFDGLELGALVGDTESMHENGHANGATATNGKVAPVVALASSQGSLSIDLNAEAKVADLIHAYRSYGRFLARLDPLSEPLKTHPFLELGRFGLAESDLARTFTAGKLIGMGAATLADILTRLKLIYCASIGVEYTHIQNTEARDWIRDKLETTVTESVFSPETRKFILKRLAESKSFEHFLHTRYVAQKRFSIEGGESLIPTLDRLIEVGADLGANGFVMGMAHRGRLNVLRNTYGKPAEHIFSEFEDNYEKDPSMGQGDVKYHKGYSADIQTRNGKSVHLSLAYNPSHLEFVNPVVEGIARSKQRDQGDKERKEVIPVLIHGEAAFAGQGVVYETLNLSQIAGYATGGTIHIVIDNQVGFTTSPIDARSTMYSTDIAKMLDAPIFHVNGDDPEALWFIAGICTEYRQRFKTDVCIDIVCYRKYGHNEGDEPTFTQPLLYKKIKNHPSPNEVYANKLIGMGLLDEAGAKAQFDEMIEKLSKAQEITRSEKPKPHLPAYTRKWQGLKTATADTEIHAETKTQISVEKFHEYGKKMVAVPSGFNVHPKLKKFLENRADSVQKGTGLDWGTGEALAFASLVDEGHTIRVSGQDVERGTFSHRHAVLNDAENGLKYCPFKNISPKQGEFIIHNSLLSETAVLGFDYGWSLADPNALVIWEAQFGDFSNGAQVIIDQFIASAESKWQRASGITLLLPHGYEGQGPEHSSARLERFLQLCAQNNMQVCNLTTPAQIFHAMRRQLKRTFRKPLVIMSPKSLLRLPQAVSAMPEFTERGFQEVLPDTAITSESATGVKRVLLCSGKLYYELLAARDQKKRTDVAIIRVEQLYPWPGDKLAAILGAYPAAEVVWVQEEPRNMGGWSHVFGIWAGGTGEFSKRVGGKTIRYVGRELAAAPAVGSHKLHVTEQTAIIEQALSGS